MHRLPWRLVCFQYIPGHAGLPGDTGGDDNDLRAHQRCFHLLRTHEPGGHGPDTHHHYINELICKFGRVCFPRYSDIFISNLLISNYRKNMGTGNRIFNWNACNTFLSYQPRVTTMLAKLTFPLLPSSAMFRSE